MLESIRPRLTEARLENRRVNEAEVSRRAVRLESQPRFVVVELTRVCNLSCVMCAGTVLPQDPGARGYHMPWALFEDVAATLFTKAELVDLRGQGESLLYPRVVEAVEKTAEAGCQVKLYSNLTVGQPRILDALMRAGAILAVSFDGASKAVFEGIRARSNFEHVVSNLKKLVAARDRLGAPADSVYLSCTVQRANLREVPEVVRLAGELGVPLVKLFARVTERQGDPESPFQHRELVARALAESAEVGDRLGVTVELGTTLHPELTAPSSVISSCANPWTNCYVAYDGAMGFCHHLTGVDAFLTGKWDRTSFAHAWNSDGYQSIRAAHGAGSAFRKGVSREATDFFKDCSWCHSMRYSDVEHLLRAQDEAFLVRLTGGRGS